MPTYVVTVKPKLLSTMQKDRIARFITDTHSKITGAPGYFAQIIFIDEPCRRYVGGQLADNQIWIRADIRAGRTPEQRSLLIEKLVSGIAEIASVPQTDIWIFLNNLEAGDMAEYGKLLSAPGKEQEWFESLPLDLQKRLSEIQKGQLL